MKKTLLATVCFTLLAAHSAAADSTVAPTEQSREVAFRAFVAKIEKQLAAEKINVKLFKQAMGTPVVPNHKALEHMGSQPESEFSFDRYLRSMVSEVRVGKGVEQYMANEKLLKRMTAKYHVRSDVLVALWGIESFYGKLPGKFRVVRSLATLAFDSHRKAFFTRELVDAARILDAGHVAPDDMLGSWAGAMGQCQFMPSSFLAYAADGDGDGHKDIWNNTADVLASTANFLHTNHWHAGEAPMQQVKVPHGVMEKINFTGRGLSVRKTLAEWHKLGVKPVEGKMPKGVATARLFISNAAKGQGYLVYHNFDVILSWNASSYFAFSVLRLAEAIDKGVADARVAQADEVKRVKLMPAKAVKSKVPHTPKKTTKTTAAQRQ